MPASLAHPLRPEFDMTAFPYRRIAGFFLVILTLQASRAGALEWSVLSESADGRRLVIEVRTPDPRRIETSLGGATFTRFELPDTRPVGSAGAPELLVEHRLLAVPPGASVRLRVLDTDLRDLGTARVVPRPILAVRYGEGASPDDPASGMPDERLLYDPALYNADGPRREPASLGRVGTLRHQSVVPLEVWPLLYDPASGRLQLVRRVRLEIQLQPSATGAGARDVGRAFLATPQSWQRVYAHTLLNAASSQRWRRAARRVERIAAPLKSGMLRPGLLAEEEWKLRVRTTGPVRVPATTLLGAGMPDGTPVERLRLVLKRFDPGDSLAARIIEIPILVEDVDQDGLFRSGDSFLFHAEHPRDDSTAGERAARYSFDNVYWFSLTESGTPARVPVRAPISNPGTGPTRFAQEITVEEDLILNRWVFGEDEELYFMLDRLPEARRSVALPGRASDSDVTVCVDTQQDWLRRAFSVFAEFPGAARIALGSSLGVNPPRTQAPPRVVVCGTVPAASVDPGDLSVILVADPVADAYDDTTPFVDNIVLRYDAEYRATNDRVRCTSGNATGPTALRIAGFSGQALLAWNVTDPKAPAAFDLAAALSSGTLTLTDDVPAGVIQHYVVVPQSEIPSLPPSAVELDQPDTIADDLANGSIGEYDVLVVSYDDFAADPALLEWAAFRQSQGHRLRIVRTSDVYDAFTGGLLHYDAIDRLVHLAYRNWGIAFVVLVGDGSEDAAGLMSSSGPNLVPARVAYFTVRASSGGGDEYRNDMQERYYAKMDGPGDLWPDLLVGRLPVSDTQELRHVVDKTILYENPRPDDDGNWRKRVLLFSDDEWVRRRVDSRTVHRRGCAEWGFFNSICQACDITNNAFPGDFRCVPFYMHEFTNKLADQVPEHAPLDTVTCGTFPNCNQPGYLGEHSGSTQTELVFYSNVGRALADSIGSGVLFFALQSHANRAVVTDEQVILRRGGSAPIVPDFNNHGKPFVFFGLGCHLNEYGVPGENVSGDALGELYVTLPERAAVASYASTGFEFLQANGRFHPKMWRMIFEKRYFRDLGGALVDSDTMTANWLLSSLLQISEISHVETDINPVFERNIIDRYALLGDPLLRLDGGVPRYEVTDLENAFVRDGRIGPIDPLQPVRLAIRFADEQGIDSLWVKKVFDDREELVPDVTVTANVDTSMQIDAKRSYTVDFQLLFDECNFELRVGARDLAGRVSEFVGRALFERTLRANGELIVDDGQEVGGRSDFEYNVNNCTPLENPLFAVLLDGEPLAVTVDSVTAFERRLQFAWDVGPGRHKLEVLLDGNVVDSYELVVSGTLQIGYVLAFPNPFEEVTSVYFAIRSAECITGGHLRIMDLNGRSVRIFNLAEPGIVMSDNAPSGDCIASVDGDTSKHWVVWDGTDQTGDLVANGVYLYELRVEDRNGQTFTNLDKLVVMR
jgi:hypothetical protein